MGRSPAAHDAGVAIGGNENILQDYTVGLAPAPRIEVIIVRKYWQSCDNVVPEPDSDFGADEKCKGIITRPVEEIGA